MNTNFAPAAFPPTNYTFKGSVTELPATGNLGEVVFNYSDSTTYVYDGTQWVSIDSSFNTRLPLDTQELTVLKQHIRDLPEGPNKYTLCMCSSYQTVVIELSFHDTSDLCALCRMRDWNLENVYALYRIEDLQRKPLYLKGDKPIMFTLKEVNIEELF